ncbi:MAG: DNA lyase [Anaerolineales bacterium]|nr:DNA lyase [Anaerolineales bacterium]
MRLWSLHPKYLDRKGLTAVWREGLLAQKVLRGLTRGYRRHPQLVRFRACRRPLQAIGAYLKEVCAEAERRGYSFNRRKICAARSAVRLPLKRGQLSFEWRHLLAKVRTRDPAKYRELRKRTRPAPHPLFRVVPGGIEDWERGAAGKRPRQPRRAS